MPPCTREIPCGAGPNDIPWNEMPKHLVESHKNRGKQSDLHLELAGCPAAPSFHHRVKWYAAGVHYVSDQITRDINQRCPLPVGSAINDFGLREVLHRDLNTERPKEDRDQKSAFMVGLEETALTRIEEYTRNNALAKKRAITGGIKIFEPLPRDKLLLCLETIEDGDLRVLPPTERERLGSKLALAQVQNEHNDMLSDIADMLEKISKLTVEEVDELSHVHRQEIVYHLHTSDIPILNYIRDLKLLGLKKERDGEDARMILSNVNAVCLLTRALLSERDEALKTIQELQTASNSSSEYEQSRRRRRRRR